ncbi:hypothetical protein SXCC_03723 [Gluconacetobacter sp. SXCC-1]|nr:hypothetical protein SXCC_03723 [Gluconacetobacter sp. SXCC-1]
MPCNDADVNPSCFFGISGNRVMAQPKRPASCLIFIRPWQPARQPAPACPYRARSWRMNMNRC